MLKKINIYIFILSFVGYSYIRGTLNGFALANKNNHNIIFLADNHGLEIPEKDAEKQLCFIKELAIILDELEEKAIFYIETPERTLRFLIPKYGILSQAKPSIQSIKEELLLFNISTEDIEIRNASLTAYKILRSENPETIYGSLNVVSASGKSCVYEDVAFRNLKEEFEMYLEKVRQLIPLVEKAYRKSIDNWLKFAENKFSIFKNILDNNKIELDDKVLPTAIQLAKSNPTLQQLLKKKILSTFAVIFDLNLTMTILTNLNQYKNIVVIAGRAHCKSLCHFFEKNSWNLAVTLQSEHKSYLKPEEFTENLFTKIKQSKKLNQ